MAGFWKKVVDKQMFTIYNNTIAERTFYFVEGEGSIVDFEAIILQHMGKDIYIGVEDSLEHSRQEAVFQNYQVLSLGGGAYEGAKTGLICSGNDRRKRVKLELGAELKRWNQLFDMTDIEARYQRYFYHIYIMEYINTEHMNLFTDFKGYAMIESII